MRLVLLTAVTMIAFAFNSILARVALEGGEIDPTSYSAVRLISGALMLLALMIYKTGFSRHHIKQGNWISAFCLFAYAVAFSFSYVNIETGVGALILFACVQASMIGWSIFQRQYPNFLEWLGIVIAMGAFIWLVSPGLSAPDPLAAFLMALSGVSWGAYTLRGKSASDPLAATMGNFVRTFPFALAILTIFGRQLVFTPFGLLLAVISGAITSGLGYALWYQVLKSLSATKSAIVQLTVPVIAGIGGAILLSEPWTSRFIIACFLILGGVAITILAKNKLQH